MELQSLSVTTPVVNVHTALGVAPVVTTVAPAAFEGSLQYATAVPSMLMLWGQALLINSTRPRIEFPAEHPVGVLVFGPVWR